VGQIENGWEIAKASWRALLRDRELLVVPVVAGLLAIVSVLAIGGAGWLLLGEPEVSTGNVAIWLIGIIALVIAAWILALGQATIVAGAGQRMDGDDPTLGSAFDVGRARAGRLLEWAVLSTVVNLVLDQIQQRLGIFGQIVAWIGGVAFSVISFLALPVIVFEDVGAIQAFRRSAELLKRTWGEQVVFGFGLGLITFIALLPVLAVAGGLAATQLVVLQVLAAAVAIVGIATVLALSSALSAVFKTALYRFATGAPVDATFDESALRRAFRER
jgi:hypothetical protein